MKRYSPRNAFAELTMIFLALIFIFPLYVILSSSFKTEHQIAASPLGLPRPFVLSNFSEAWSGANMGDAFLNTVIITVLSVFGLVLFGSLAGYVLARRTERLSTLMYYVFLLGLVIPQILTLVPLYSLIQDAGLLGTYWSLVLVYLGGQLPFAVFLFAGFIRALPRDYEEAATVDGAPPWVVFTRIVLPLMRPVIGAVIILNAVLIWNDFLNPLLYLTGSGKQTLAVSIYTFVGQYYQQWNLIFAGVVMAALPMIGVFFLLQRSFFRSFGGVLKG